MTKALQKSYHSFSFLFLLNWNMLMSFVVTALALAAGAYLVTL